MSTRGTRDKNKKLTVGLATFETGLLVDSPDELVWPPSKSGSSVALHLFLRPPALLCLRLFCFALTCFTSGSATKKLTVSPSYAGV
jgi:hypothetical protein